MKTTNSKDSVKVNQILPIMQDHFGQNMNLARIKLMALLLHALCVVQTVSLHKLADAMPTAVDKDSNLRRLQRFFAKYVLDLADRAYAQTLQRFIIGKADINTLTLSHSRQQEASKNYITSLQNYWLSYYKIRKLTLFDFELGVPIPTDFDRTLGVK